jgi:Ca2+-binding EF-hand superfamily protein
MDKVYDWISRVFRTDTSIPDETMEEYRMLSGLKPKEIARLHKMFSSLVEGNNDERLKKEQFLEMECIVHNPLKDRVAQCFGFDEEHISIDFKGFLTGLALFNSPGQVENKIKVAFKIQDFDDDGMINKHDLIEYLKLITAENSLSDEEYDRIATTVLEESSSDEKFQHLTYNDFQRVVASQDLQAKLLIPI